MKSHMTREQAEAWVATLADGEGIPVDEYIRPLVAALTRLGVQTTASCHGHERYIEPCPWVRLTYRDLTFVAGLVARQNRPSKRDGSFNENLWVLYPSGLHIKLLPLNRNRHLAKLRADAYEFAEFLHELADSG
jgi:hypothetical protein